MPDRKLLTSILGATLLMSALPGIALAQDEAPALAPDGVEWTLSSLAGAPVPDEVTVTLFMSGGEVVGNAGCNSYFGSYEIDGDSLTFPLPFGATQKFCEGPEMDVEAAYLPLLQETATWGIDETGALSLADVSGTVQLVYGEAPVDVTASDVDALVATLGDLQAQIDAASAQVAALAAETEAIPVNRFDRRVRALEDGGAELRTRVDQLETRTGNQLNNLRQRIVALEETVARLDRTIDRFRDRILALEASEADQAQRIAALEDEVFQPGKQP